MPTFTATIIHFGFVGIKAGIPGIELEIGADLLDLILHREIYISDRKWIALGIHLAQRFEPEQITADLLVREMLALMPEVAELECDPENPKSVRPIVKQSATNPLLNKPKPRIMVVGDSITHGQSGDYTWRFRLHEHLRATSQGFEFVGPFRGPLEPNLEEDARKQGTYRVGGWDDDHDATWGRALGFEQSTIEGFVRTYQPDLVIVHLGTNDLTWFSDPNAGIDGNAARVANQMRAFIINARRAKPDVDFVLTRIGATRWLEDRGQPTAYNNMLSGIAPELTTVDSCIAVADVQSNWDWRRDTYDQTHLNARGEFVIAQAVANELHHRWAYGANFGGIPPTSGPFEIKPSGGRVTPSVVGNGGRFKVEWDPVPNDVWTEYRVGIRTHKEFGFMPVYRSPSTTQNLEFEFSGPLPFNGIYHIIVWAEDIHGRKAASDPIPVTVGQFPPPPKPSNIRLTPSPIGQDGGFVATWERVFHPGIWTEYQVRVHTHHGFGFTPVYVQPGWTPFLSWTYDGPRFPIPGVYDVVVVARDIHGLET